MTRNDTAANPRRIPALEDMARDMVGDGKSPNLFFVTDRGAVVSVNRDFDVAYSQWQDLERAGAECALEDRKTGTIASRTPDEERDNAMYTVDDTYTFKYR
jgi:hypothetical protein